MRRLLFLLVTTSLIIGPEPVSYFSLDPVASKAEARPGGRGGGMRGGGGASFGARGGGGRSFGSMGARPSAGRPAGSFGTRPSTLPSTGGINRPSTLPTQPSLGVGSRPSTRPSTGVGNRPSTLPARPGAGGPIAGERPSVRPPLGGPRPTHPIALPPGSKPPGYRPPGWRPPEWRPPYYPPPYPRPPDSYWGDYYWWPSWGWYFTGAIAGATLVYVATLSDKDCEEVIYKGEKLYLCDGVLYRATIYKDEPVYEIVTEPDEKVPMSATGPVGTYADDRVLELTSPRMQGDRVVALQKALAGRGYDPGSVDGVFGPATDRALRDFQQKSNLDVTGAADEATRAALGL